jgi:hypothetical protein
MLNIFDIFDKFIHAAVHIKRHSSKNIYRNAIYAIALYEIIFR